MKTGVLKRAMGLVLIYIGVFALIIFVQFSRSGGFLAKAGRLSVSASWTSADRKGPPSKVKIDYAGLQFSLSPSNPAKLRLADGSLVALNVQTVEKLAGGARVVFEGGGELRLLADSTPGLPFKLSAQRPRPDADALLLPYTVASRSAFSAEGDKTLFQSAGGPYELSLSGGSFEDDKAVLVLVFGDGSQSGIALKKSLPPAPAAPTHEPVVAKLLPPSPMDPAAYKTAVDAWTSKAYLGLALGRWDGEKLGWKDGLGNTQFSEKALVAYLAEAESRGAYTEALAKMKPAASRNTAALSWLSTPFFGDTVVRMSGLETADLIEVKRLAGLAQSSDPGLLEKENLLHFLIDRSPAATAQTVLQVIAGFDVAKLSPTDVVAYLDCAVEAKGFLTEAENPFKAVDAAADRLVGAVTKTPEGWFLKTEDDGSIDIRKSLVAGLSLLAWGQTAGKDALVGAGQSLVVSALGLGDASGFLPARLSPKAEGGSDRLGSLAPEDCYPLVATAAYYPRELSFYKELGAGVWAWTCSPSIAVTASQSSSIFTVGFPAGLTHYMAVYGLRPFSNIKLYGINYSPDSAFESYDASGYLYRKASNALYLKMKHKQAAERIELYY